MQGQILQLNDEQRTGLILGSDGKRYGFAAADWRGSTAPDVGRNVDFVPDEDKARDIFPVNAAASASASASSASAAYGAPATDNSVVLGGLGVGCLVLNFVFPVLPLIAALVLGLLGSNAAKQSGNSTGLLLSRIAWIGAVVLVLVVILLVALGLSLFGWMAGLSFHEFMRGNWSGLQHTVAWVVR